MIKNLLYLCATLFLMACSGPNITADEESHEHASIFPDYADCVIPPNIAPLNFKLTDSSQKAVAYFTSNNASWSVQAKKGQFTIPASKWKKMLQDSMGDSVSVKILIQKDNKWIGYAPFTLYVAPEPIDPYIAYRLIEPGYELWFNMGIYQRDLESYEQSPIMENKLTNGSCMNCHSFCMQDPDKMLFHLRGPISSTILIDGEKIEKLNTKTEQTMSPLVYPAWHPGGRYVAFSVNDTKQAFHMNDLNRVEVYDNKSDVVVYDVQKHEIITSSYLYGSNTFESFPTFSPDGKTLYFSSAEFVSAMPQDFDKVRYSLCSISFDPSNGQFGNKVDTLYNANEQGRSASFPRVSPDGKFLMYSLADYGGFHIWHKEADLCLINLATNEHSFMEKANSNDADSYHSWSSNSRWIVFSSRRIDGLYTRPHIAYVSESGEAQKAFLLPQKEVDFYHRLMYSYNVPEFIKGKVSDRRYAISTKVKDEKGIDVKFGKVQR